MTLEPETRRSWLMSLSAWDARLALESAAFTAIFLVLVTLVTALTDEGGISWEERFARSLPLAPICAALASGFALVGPARRGETRALEALGRQPLVSGSVAAFGAVGVGTLTSALLLWISDVSILLFFPTVPSAAAVTFAGGTFSNRAQGWRVLADGTLSFVDSSSAALATSYGGSFQSLPPHARGAAVLVTLVGSLAFSLLVAFAAPRRTLDPRGATRCLNAGLVLLLTAAASVFCLQAAASRRVDPLVAVLPSTLLLLALASAIVRPAWQAVRFPDKTPQITPPSPRT